MTVEEKISAKVITPPNQNRSKQRREPVRTLRSYLCQGEIGFRFASHSLE